MTSTYTTFYYHNPQWYNTGSTNIIYYNTYTTFGNNCSSWIIDPPHEPKFKIGDTIIYLRYLKWSNKIAIHTIKDIRDGLYIFDNSYYLDEEYTMDPVKTDEDFILYSECLEKYPDLILKAKRNGPPEGYVKEKLKKK